jgi:hypothetical protein
MSIKYLLSNGQITENIYSEPDFAALMALPEERRPVFLAETDPLVVAYLAAQADALKPKEVTMRQARLALLEVGKLAAVTAAIAGMPGVTGDAARIEWEYSSVLKRGQPLVGAMSAVLGLSAAQVDALFLSASTK